MPTVQDVYKARVLDTNPYAYYLLDEASGLAQDSSGNGFHHENSATPTYGLAGPFEGAKSMRFAVTSPATGNAFSMDHAAAGIGDTCVALEAWIMVESISGPARFIHSQNLEFQVNADRTLAARAFGLGADPAGLYGSSTGVLSLNTWHYVRFNRLQGGTARYWIDNVEETPTGTKSIATPYTDIYTGPFWFVETTLTIRLSNVAIWEGCPSPPINYPAPTSFFVPQIYRRVRGAGAT